MWIILNFERNNKCISIAHRIFIGFLQFSVCIPDHRRIQNLFTGHAQDTYTIIIVLDNGKGSVVCREVCLHPKNTIVLVLSIINVVEISRH